MTVSEDITVALEHLQSAADESGMGTAMMLETLMSELREIQARYDRINDNENEHER